MKEVIQCRVRLFELLALVQALGASRELALAVTTLQSARMQLGTVAHLLGSPSPYPQADNPKSAEVAPVADVPAADVLEAAVKLIAGGSPVENVKLARVAVQGLVDTMTTWRRVRWPKSYGSLEELIYDRALVDVILAKQWLGEQLAVIAGHPVVKPRTGGVSAPATRDDGPVTIDKVIEAIGKLAYADKRIAAGLLWQSIEKDEVAAETPAAALERGLKVEMETSGTEGRDPVVTPELAALARNAVDDTIREWIAGGATVTEICRVLNVTEHRVNKIKKAMKAEKVAAEVKRDEGEDIAAERQALAEGATPAVAAPATPAA